MEKGVLLVISLMFSALFLSIVSVPTTTWLYLEYVCDKKFESFGPRADRLLIKLYPSFDNACVGMENNEIDLMDTPLTQEMIEKWSQPPYNESIKLASYPEFGMYEIDINNNPNPYLGNPPDPEYPNPVYPNPCGMSEFRHALAHLIDRQYIADHIWNGSAVPMYTVIPPSQSQYVHSEIRPGGQLENLTHPYDLQEAAAILDAAGFPVGPDGWRYWDRNGNEVKDSDEELELAFYIRYDDPRRSELGNWFADQLESEPVKVHVMKRIFAVEPVFLLKNYHLYTGDWSLGVDPDHLVLWHTDYYWHPGFPYNYGAVNCSEFNSWCDRVVYASSFEEAEQSCIKAQEALASPNCVGCIPVVCSVDTEAVKQRYTGTPDTTDKEDQWEGQYWKGVVNTSLGGLHNRWTLLNMHPECSPVGDGENMTVRWGFKVDKLGRLNPLYTDWVWDWNVLNLIYDSLLIRDPYTQKWKPDLCKSFDYGTWVDPFTGETKGKVIFELRDDVYWHDGVKFTAADVRFSLHELPQILQRIGPLLSPIPPPEPVILECDILGPYIVRVLLNINCIWPLSDVGSTVVLPKHVWDPLLESYTETGLPDITGFSPDPNLIGTGPWRLVEYVEKSHISLVVNKPGATITTNLSNELGPAQPTTSLYGYFRLLPIDVCILIDVPSEYKYLRKAPPCTDVTFNITLHNMLLNLPIYGNLTVDQYVWIVHPNGTEELVLSQTDLTIPSGAKHEDIITRHFERCHHQIKVAVHITGPPKIPCTKGADVVYESNPWICQWKNMTYDFWITIKEDIAEA